MNKARNKINDYQREINAREEELGSLRARLHQKAEELKVAEIGAVAYQHRAQDFGKEVSSKDEEIRLLRSQIDDLRQQVVYLHSSRKSEGTALLEIEHVKADNDRLIKMLKTTKDFKSFGKFADKNTGSLRYLPNNKKSKC